MVGWFDPGQLALTGSRVLVSTFFAAHADNRLIESITWGEGRDYDYSALEEMWLDYTADTGDGFDSTFAVAYWMTRPELHGTRRGSVLVFGGDEVYPAASRDDYKTRLRDVYEMAFPRSEPPHPEVFAIPGNHDWYDSLVAFTRFFGARKWFAGWRAPQTRSYFALRLPHHWWLVATDIQLDADVDRPQLEYFEAIAGQMAPEDRVILCNAEPFWIQAHLYERLDPRVSRNNLAFLTDEVFCNRVRVIIAGDSHHYRHHVSPDGSLHEIVAGGGGAFLHLTNGPDVSVLNSGERLLKQWPPPETSRRLAWRNLLFPLINPKFGFLFTGLLYALVGLAVAPTIAQDAARFSRFGIPLPRLTTPSTLVFWSMLVILGTVLFTDTHSKRYRWIAGGLHGLAHVIAVSALIAFACRFGFAPTGVARLAAYLAIIYAGGAIIGPLILGIYLLVSVNVFGRHTEDASASLRIPDWKNFLRLHIALDGTLTIRPFGIRRVPREWRAGADGRLHPDDPAATMPELIDEPLVIPIENGGR
jgi:hypothetical protein